LLTATRYKVRMVYIRVANYLWLKGVTYLIAKNFLSNRQNDCYEAKRSPLVW